MNNDNRTAVRFWTHGRTLFCVIVGFVLIMSGCSSQEEFPVATATEAGVESSLATMYESEPTLPPATQEIDVSVPPATRENEVSVPPATGEDLSYQKFQEVLQYCAAVRDSVYRFPNIGLEDYSLGQEVFIGGEFGGAVVTEDKQLQIILNTLSDCPDNYKEVTEYYLSHVNQKKYTDTIAIGTPVILRIEVGEDGVIQSVLIAATEDDHDRKTMKAIENNRFTQAAKAYLSGEYDLFLDALNNQEDRR